MLRINCVLMLLFLAMVLVCGQEVDCGGEQEKQFTRYVLSIHKKLRKPRNLTELTYSCGLGRKARESVQGCPEALPRGFEKDANFGRYEVDANVSIPVLAVRILYYWMNRDQMKRMLRPDVSTVGCSVDVCPVSYEENRVAMSCFYGDSDGKIIVETTPKPFGCGLTDENTIGVILKKHNEVRKASNHGKMEWSCELETRAAQAIEECPVSLPEQFETEANFYRLTAQREVRSTQGVVPLVLLKWTRGVSKEKQKMAQGDKTSVGCSLRKCPVTTDGKYPVLMACFYGN